MSGKILLIFAFCIFSTLPSINTIWIKNHRGFNPHIFTNSYWHFGHLYGHKNKIISGYGMENSMETKEPLNRELTLEKTPVVSKGNIIYQITQDQFTLHL